MVPSKQGVAAGLYSKLEADRSQYVQDGAQCAELTIPSLFPRNPDGTAKPLTPYQSVGARGVNNIASKMSLALFPPNTSIFRLKIEDEVLAQLAQRENIKTKVEQGLAGIERRTTSELESKGLHTSAFEIFKHLVVVGNALVYLPDEGQIKTYSLHNYVVRRDYSGNPLEIVVKEKIAMVALPIATQEALAANKKQGEKAKEEVEIYTHVRRLKDRWEAYQECGGSRIDGTYGTYPIGKCPWIPLWLIKQDGRNYGWSYVNEYKGDLLSLEGLSQALLEGAIAAAKILFLVDPNGTTDKDDLAKARNGDYVDGSATNVTSLQLNKYNDFRVALEQANTITERLSFAFLLNSAVQRRGERVTAEEIRYVARELEDSLGGIYSLMTQDLQMKLVAREMHNLTRQKKLPDFPKEAVNPVIITGLEALGRGNDLAKLELAMSKVVGLGPDVIAKRLNVSDYIDRVFTSCGVDTKGLLKTDAQVQAEEQQAAQQAMLASGVPNAVNAGGKMIQQGMTNDQSPS
jgi:Bacteriophage head to tail connecting protein